MITLNLDHAFLERSAGAAALLEGLGQLFERFFGQRDAADGGNRLAATALAFTTYTGNAVPFGDGRLFAGALGNGLTTIGAMAPSVG